MANELDGLFGPTPQQVQQQQYLAQRQFAMDTAKMNSLDLAKYGAGMAGAGVGGLLAPALGIQNPAMQQAKMQEQIMGSGDTDLTTSKGMLAKADEFRKAGDLRTAMALTLKGKELEKQEAAAALANRKQDFQEQQAFELKQEQMRGMLEQKKAQLEQQAEAARLRSEDRQASIQQRADAAREANATKLQIAQLVAALKNQPKEKTPAQVFKEQQAEAKSAGVLRGMDTTLQNMTEQASAIANHPGLSGATGILGMLPSVPGGQTKQAENLIDEFKSSVKKAGLDLARQGGSIGSMTEREWPIVEGMVASIDPKAGAQSVKDQMQKVLAKVDQIRQNAYQTHNEGFEGSLTPKSISYGSSPKTTPSISKRIKFDANGNMVQQ